MEENKKHGGAREGAGREKAFEEVKPYQIKTTGEKRDKIKALLKEINSIEKNTNDEIIIKALEFYLEARKE